MTATILLPELKAALTKIKPSIPTRGSALPVLSGVRLSANDGRLHIVGTDLDLTGETSIEAELDGDGLEAVVPFKNLLAFVTGKTKKGAGVLSVNDDTVRIETDTAKHKLYTLSVDEWPRVASVPGSNEPFVIDPIQALRVCSAASKDEYRPILTGVCFDGEFMVSTDSYRLHVVEAPSTATSDTARIVPAKALAVAAKAAKGEAIVARFGDKDVSLQANGITWTVRIIEGDFPNWQGLFPHNPPVTMTVDTEEFLFALGEVAPVLKGTNAPLKLHLHETHVTLKSDVADVGGTEADVPADISGLIFPPATDGDEPTIGLTVAFNPDFLADTLTGTDRATFRLIDQLKPAVITPHDDITDRRLLMPVRQ